MNIRDLKYLVAVADYKHFCKAADACFVSQPALSMQIKKLEETLGVTLFERTNKSVLITDIGKVVIQHAREILQQIDNMKNATKQACDPFSGTLHLGIIPTLAPYLLPHIFTELSEKFPKLTIYLVEDVTANLLKKLSEGKLDCALLALPLPEVNFTTHALFDEAFLLTVSKNHALAKLKFVQLTDLNHHTLLLLDEGHCLRDQTLQVCHQANAVESLSFRATSLETLRHMVASNVGITLMPKLACYPNDSIRYIPFKSIQPKRKIGMIWRPSSSKAVILNNLVEEIKSIMKC
jgi:LysR family transcriptional regulator, hydrogen peroxide-inducible genes activator